MTLQHLIDTYGYAAIFIGCLLEGETILLLGGIAAKLEYLKLHWVIVTAFTGTLFADQFLFFLGRRKGEVLLEKWPVWRKRADKVLPILERHRLLVIIGFRFVYGTRTITPFVLGMSRVTIREFLFLNIISAAAWASLVGFLGFTFGYGVELILGDIRRYEMAMFFLILIVAFLLWLRRIIRQ